MKTLSAGIRITEGKQVGPDESTGREIQTESSMCVQKVALIGASGFIGIRASEMLSADPRFTLRPIVRAPSSLAVLARQRLDWKVCDLLNEKALSQALTGITICVHAAIGNAAQIVKMAKATYHACAAAGVRRLVWLSSASVHGQNPLAGTDELSELNDKHALIYNNAKVRAEWALDQSSIDGRVEVVRLRPSIVYGPRSRWISDVAEAVRNGRAGWISGGRGVCNAIYVDNLVAAIQHAALNSRSAGHSFLIRDEESLTWRDFLLPIAKHLGRDEHAFTEMEVPLIVPERENIMTTLTMTPIYAHIAPYIPDRAKRLIKAVASAWPARDPELESWQPRSDSKLELKPEMALLQQATWRFPTDKARQILDYRPPIAFDEGMKRSLIWLDSCR